MKNFHSRNIPGIFIPGILFPGVFIGGVLEFYP